MDRARRAGLTALIVIVMVASAAGAHGSAALAVAVDWPPSTLVVSEVQTGGASASDEFVEIANQGSAPADLLGLEVVYATSSGSTVTRKATWAVSLMLGPGQRFLLGNGSGVFGSVADATYSGGFAATGGAVALRVVGGSAIDAVGWGDATNAFVEGTTAPAPPAGSSLERLPGGAAGNATDTNANAQDWFVQGAPSPQGLGAPPVPVPGASPTPTPSGTPTPTPSPIASVTPTPTPSPTPTPTSRRPHRRRLTTPTPTPTPIADPDSDPDARSRRRFPPRPRRPSPTSVSIAAARALADGETATIEGVLTTRLGALESGRSGFIQDASGGIALYLDDTVTGDWPAGTSIRVEGTVASRFSQRTFRIAEADITGGPVAPLPDAVRIATGAATESVEGIRVTVSGTVVGAPDQLTDGLGVTIDDGSGPVRAVIGPDAAGGMAIGSGMLATVTGPLGQRDSTGTGSAGYRIQATLPGELELGPSPTADAHRLPRVRRRPPRRPRLQPRPRPPHGPRHRPRPRQPRPRRRRRQARPRAPRRRVRSSRSGRCELSRSARRCGPPAWSPRKPVASAPRRCWPSSTRPAASSSICRPEPARTRAERCSTSRASSRHRTASSRSARRRPTSVSSGPARSRPRTPSRRRA